MRAGRLGWTIGLFLALLVLGRSIAVQAAPREALVIGQSNYAQAVGPLSNPGKDAVLIGQRLEALGFKVTVVQNLGRLQLLREVSDYVARLNAAGPGALGFLYYSGHGVGNPQDGSNYLIPVDVASTSTSTFWDEAVSLDDILKRLSRGAPGADEIVVFDACREALNLPFKGANKGLTRQADVPGLLVAYSTSPNAVAPDGDGTDRSGPYATALADVLARGGGDVVSLFEQVKYAVHAKTGQLPWTSNGISHPLVLGSLTQPQPTFPPAPGGAVVQPPDPKAVEFSYWTSSNCGSGDVEGCRAYKRKFPQGEYVEIADLKLRPSPLAVAGHQSLAQVPVAPVTSPSLLPDARQLAASVGAPVVARGQSIADFAAFRDCSDCVEMVALPGGSYTMGSPSSEAGRFDDEEQVSITLSRFAISRFPVTKGEYGMFAAATGRPVDHDCDSKSPGDRNPVTCVSWDDAKAYALWLTEKTGTAYRLLSESEYEYANRGGTMTAYWWGDTIGVGHANCDGCGSAWDKQRTAPVGSFAPNAYGLFETTGNVFSWTSDCYNQHATSRPRDGGADTTGECKFRVLRGGSWYGSPRDLRSAIRGRVDPTIRYGVIGFRLARTLSPP